MKKVGLLSVLLTCLFLISCNVEAKKTEYNVRLNLSAGSGRTITSCDVWNIEELEWSFTFTDETHDKVIKPVESTVSTSGTYDFILPIGEYTIEAVADFEGHTIYGKASHVDISIGLSTPTIYVGLKKTEDGTGTFGPFTINVKDSEFDINDIYLKKCDSDNDEDIYILTYTKEDSVIQIAAKDDISSGYYYLLLSNGQTGAFEKLLPLEDQLVEIADDETVTGSVNTLVLETKKVLYVSNENTGFAGLTPSYKIGINELFEKIDTLDVNEVQLYATENLKINLDNLPFTDKVITITESTDDYHGTYKIVNKKIIPACNETESIALIFLSYEDDFVTVSLDSNKGVNLVSLQGNITVELSNPSNGLIPVTLTKPQDYLDNSQPVVKINKQEDGEYPIFYLCDAAGYMLTKVEDEDSITYFVTEAEDFDITVKTIQAFKVARIIEGEVCYHETYELVFYNPLEFCLVDVASENELESPKSTIFSWYIDGVFIEETEDATFKCDFTKLDDLELAQYGEHYITCRAKFGNQIKSSEGAYIITLVKEGSL